MSWTLLRILDRYIWGSNCSTVLRSSIPFVRETVRNPRGPRADESFDPSEPGVAKRVHKGGSFLCTDQYCARYMPGGRSKGAPDTGTNHLGFRLVKDGFGKGLPSASGPMKD
ncbi:MAG: SUMF1/EgtB/PvdO family nonheme iron enzyme [Nitrospiraceae bacterium]